MPEKKVISIRFHTENEEDMRLYHRLEQEAGTTMSLASVVKARIKKSYEPESRGEIQEPIMEAIRSEMENYGMKLVGALLSGMGGAGGSIPLSPVLEGNKLPEESEELPSGALDFLE